MVLGRNINDVMGYNIEHMSSSKDLVEKVLDFYLNSRDFNGIPLGDLYKYSGLAEEDFKTQLLSSIKSRKVDLIYEEPNPHIKPFPAPLVEKQTEKLSSLKLDEEIESIEKSAEVFGSGEVKIRFAVDTIGCCVYPTPEYLRATIDWTRYVNRPFTLRLAMGEWQLRPYFFELGVLAIYRNDPRYRYHTDDITGSLNPTSEDELNPSDQIFIQHFGFGFDDKGNRSVAVLLTDLSKLTPQHQQIWNAKVLSGYYRFKLHPDFRKSILGHFYDGDSVFSAFIEEIKIINQMAMNIKGKPLFNKTFERDEKPDNFGFLILPTQREFEQFALTLDRMLFDNVNSSFFDGLIEKEDLKEKEDLDKISSFRKMEVWINKVIKFPDPRPKDDMFKTIRKIRGLRSKPAHTYIENEWNNKFFSDQKELIKEAYRAIRTLRLILANNPKSRDVEIPDWLQSGQIRTF